MSSCANFQEVVYNAETDMTEINNLTDQNGFVISILKYSIMIVSLHLEKTLAIVSKIRTIQVELNTANELRIFRVTIAADLKWSTYASNLRALVNKMVSFLNLFGCTLNVTICLKILIAFVTPTFTYGLLVCMHVEKTNCTSIMDLVT